MSGARPSGWPGRIARRGARPWLVLAGLVLAVGDGAAQVALPETKLVGNADRLAEARAYEHGEGVERNPLRAAALYCDAARAGDVEGQVSLAWMYANGRGVARDDAAAAALYVLAAASGHEYAQRMQRFFSGVTGKLPACMREPVRPLAVVPPSAEFEIVFDDADPFANLPRWKQDIADIVNRIAPTYAIDPRLALAIITVESNFDPTALSEKGARGLMQLIPKTAARFNVRDAYDVGQNLRGGLAYLRWLLAYYQGRVLLATAAYNAGEKAVDRYGGIPPYAETRAYVQRVQRLFRFEHHPYDSRIVDPSPVVSAVAKQGS